MTMLKSYINTKNYTPQFPMDKKAFHQFLVDKITKDLQELKGQVLDLQNELKNDTKSTAGDKHETSRAMNQIEQENIGKRIHETELNLQQLMKLDPLQSMSSAQMGALLQTTMGNLYLGVSLGNIQWEQQSIFCISFNAPIAKVLLHLKEGESFSWQNNTYTLTQIW